MRMPNAREEGVCAEHTRNLDELVVVVVAVEERLALEDEGGKHAAQAPHVEAVVVLLEVASIRVII